MTESRATVLGGSKTQSVMDEVADREHIYRELQPIVTRLVRQYGNTAELRKDLPGECYCRFVRLWEAYDSSRGVPLRLYLIRQLRAAIYSYARKVWTYRDRTVPLIECHEDIMADPLTDPCHQVIDRATKETLRTELLEKLAALPKRQRQVIIWRYIDSLSFEEIADRLEIKTASARSLLRHGLNNLRLTLLS